MPFRSLLAAGLLTFAIPLLWPAAAAPTRADDWPHWRGLREDGICRESGLLKEWPADGPRQLWNVKLGGGFSDVVVADGRLFTQTRDGKQEVVLCFDPATGKEVWRYGYDCDYKDYPSFTGGGMPASRTGPRSTPTVDGDRLYAQGATGVLLCLDVRSGKKVWEQSLLKLSGIECPSHGFCGCPLIVGDRLFVQPGGPNGKSVAALNKKDGSVIWQALDDPIAPSSPIFAEVAGTPQVIFFTGVAAIGVAPRDGKLLWRYPWKTQYDLNIATPIVHDDLVFISSNYGTGAALFRVNRTSEPETIWKGKSMQNHISTCVLYGGHLYGFSEQRLRCVDFKTGEVKWDQADLGRGTALVADGQLIVLGDKGQLILARASADGYHEISRCQVFDRNTLTWTVPVVSGGRLFVRSEYALKTYDVSGKGR
jgi:outer membrane protein assembly factor BamB